MAPDNAETKAQNWPRFRPQEVVRITRLYKEDERRDRLGATGIVEGLEPDPEERRRLAEAQRLSAAQDPVKVTC